LCWLRGHGNPSPTAIEKTVTAPNKLLGTGNFTHLFVSFDFLWGRWRRIVLRGFPTATTGPEYRANAKSEQNKQLLHSETPFETPWMSRIQATMPLLNPNRTKTVRINIGKRHRCRVEDLSVWQTTRRLCRNTRLAEIERSGVDGRETPLASRRRPSSVRLIVGTNRQAGGMTVSEQTSDDLKI
jgi:hypothetical protein